MRPEGGDEEALRAWNARWLAETFARLDTATTATPAEPMTMPANEDPSGVPAAPGLAEMPPEPPPPDSGPQNAATAEPVPSQAEQAGAAEAAVRLPYPFNLMNPADVPERVWQQARRCQQDPR
jgi:hypothetical protein